MEGAHDGPSADLCAGAALDQLVSNAVPALGLLDVLLRLCNKAINLSLGQPALTALLANAFLHAQVPGNGRLVPMKKSSYLAGRLLVLFVPHLNQASLFLRYLREGAFGASPLLRLHGLPHRGGGQVQKNKPATNMPSKGSMPWSYTARAEN